MRVPFGKYHSPRCSAITATEAQGPDDLRAGAVNEPDGCELFSVVNLHEMLPAVGRREGVSVAKTQPDDNSSTRPGCH